MVQYINPVCIKFFIMKFDRKEAGIKINEEYLGFLRIADDIVF